MKKWFVALTLMLMLATSAYAESAAKLQALSAWTNQSGSTLYINSVDNNGQLTGTYIDRAAGYQCQSTPYPVTGWIYGTAIIFTTTWKNATESCNSITSWTGFYYNGEIHTLWQLVKNVSSSTNQILKGSDTFTPPPC